MQKMFANVWLLQIEGVEEVHDLHVWALTPGIPLLAVHLNLSPRADATRVLNEATEYCRGKNIEHSTIQLIYHGQECCGSNLSQKHLNPQGPALDVRTGHEHGQSHDHDHSHHGHSRDHKANGESSDNHSHGHAHHHHWFFWQNSTVCLIHDDFSCQDLPARRDLFGLNCWLVPWTFFDVQKYNISKPLSDEFEYLLSITNY